MKLAHIGDLHLGIVLNHVNMAEEQRYILDRILDILHEEKPEAVLIAGDVYDRAVPSAEASVMLGRFLSALSEGGFETFMIAGNHDSGDRLSYAGSLLEKQRIHISGTYTGRMPSWTLTDAYGPVRIWLLPFLRPSHVNRYAESEEERVMTYTEAVRTAVRVSEVDFTQRNVIVSHQFVAGSSVHENGSEQLSVGGTDAVAPDAYAGFDYAALGHIHSVQKAGGEEIRYCGTPLKYSFSEEHDRKGILFAELGRKGELAVFQRELKPLHDMRTRRGRFAELMSEAEKDPCRDDYLRVILTDEQEIDQAARRLRMVWKNLLRLEYDNTRTRNLVSAVPMRQEEKSPLEIFAGFFAQRNGREMNEKEEKIAAEMIARIWETEEDA